jgi:Mn-dependent DtxR family transcriptional regulator
MDAIFTTNQYKVLEIMYDNTIKISEKEYCPLSQAEIAEELKISRAVVNKIFIELKQKKYIYMLTRGKWKLSEDAQNMIRITREI